MVDNFSKTNGGIQEQQHNVFHWQPETILSEPYKADGRGHGCMILDRDVRIPANVVTSLWENGKHFN